MKITGLIKIGQKEHLKQLLFERHLYMNTLGYFRKCEGISQDENEGTNYILQGKKTILTIFPHGGTIGHAPIKFKNWVATNMNDLNKNVFCMHAVFEENTSFDPENLKRGDFALVIYSVDDFLQILDNKKQINNHILSYKLVEYVCKKTYQGELGPFKKFEEFKGKDYKKENEFRIVLAPGEGNPKSIYLESLEKIACMVAVTDLLATIKEKFGS